MAITSRSLIVLLLLVIGASVALLMSVKALSTPAHAAFTAGSVVKVKLDKGHGSAVHIGDGFYLTAQHVVTDLSEVTILSDDGVETKAEVLWANSTYDVALLRGPSEGVQVSPLACRVAIMDEPVFALGNPLRMENIKTRGHIAGRPHQAGPWKSVLPINIAIAGGMSGGAILDQKGEVVGIIVGVPIQPIGMGGSMVGIGFAVDGLTVCGLLARA